MGILDSKSRVLDTIVTLEGRRQISSGKLRVKYVSFTDTATYYKADVASGSADATVRLYLEANHLPQDQITFEADDSGLLKPFGNSDGTQVKNGQILAYSFDAINSFVLSGSNQSVTTLKGDEFASSAGSLLASSIDNFNKLRVIATKDNIFEDDGFGVGNDKIEFVIHNDRPISDPQQFSTNVNHLESIFNDVRLSKLKNFEFLPPINKLDDASINKSDHRNTSAHQMGHYIPWGRSHIYGLSGRQIEHELSHFENMGYSKTISFDPTSNDNKLVGQFFEINHSSMNKLDVIDFGQYSYNGSIKHTFFVGKVMTDQNCTNTFIHIFTLVFG